MTFFSRFGMARVVAVNGLIGAAGGRCWPSPWWPRTSPSPAVTIFLHRSQAHRALDLGPSHRTSSASVAVADHRHGDQGWVAIHRKHHARLCETVDDPHSPVIKGIETVLLRAASSTAPGQGAGDARQVRPRHARTTGSSRNLFAASVAGRGLMLIIDLLLFGAIGATVWAVQMLWIPDHRGRHHQRHRPLLGLPQLRGGGRLDQRLALGHRDRRRGAAQQPPHLPDLAKLSVKPYEFDIGWGYIRAMEMLGWAKGAQRRRRCSSSARSKAGGRRQDAGGDHRQPLRGDGQVRHRAARRLRRRARPAEGAGGENTARIRSRC